jgi:hypothetical protein
VGMDTANQPLSITSAKYNKARQGPRKYYVGVRKRTECNEEFCVVVVFKRSRRIRNLG